MDTLWAAVLALVPSLGIGFLFYRVMKALLEGDRNERLAHARWEAERAADAGLAGSSTSPGTTEAGNERQNGQSGPSVR